MNTGRPESAITWSGSVTELVRNFATALSSLVPMAEAIQMGWREGEAYDDWDRIADALYKSFVANPLAWADGNGADARLPLAPYGMVVSDYSVFPVLLVHGDVTDERSTDLIFRRLVTESSPFDSVEASDVRQPKEPGVRIRLGSARFLARLKRTDGQTDTIDQVHNVL